MGKGDGRGKAGEEDKPSKLGLGVSFLAEMRLKKSYHEMATNPLT